MKIRFLVLVGVSILFSSISAQTVKRRAASRKEAFSTTILNMYQDSLSHMWDRYFGIHSQDSVYSSTMPPAFAKTDWYSYMHYLPSWNPRLSKLFLPLTLYKAPVKQAFYPEWKQLEINPHKIVADTLFPSNIEYLDELKEVDRRVNRTLANMYVSHPEWVLYTEEQISQKKSFRKDIERKLPPKIKVFDLFQPEEVITTEVGEPDLLIRKPNFWTFSGNGSIQFTQNYISENWYKGGESTNSLLSYILLATDYDNKRGFQFNNSLEMKLGFITTPSDSLHSYRTSSDLLRLSTKLVLQAVANWNYTLQAEFKTQFMPNYKKDTNTMASAFFAPATVSVSLGMDYTYKKEKKLNLSVLLSPLSYNYTYVGNKAVDPADFINSGARSLSEVGYKIGLDTEWSIIPAIIWISKLTYFSNYNSVKAEWENTFNFVLNRFLSTKLFVHARYDDSVKPIVGKSYFQLQELLSFGINYKW